MIRLALVGKNISHSRSQIVYERLLGRKISYDLLDFSTIEEIPPMEELLRKYSGVSVTAPYKSHFFRIDLADEYARIFGLVNCLGKKMGQIHMTNTDYVAVKEIVGDLLQEFSSLDIVLLGDGAMAKMTASVLEEHAIPFTQLSRRQDGDLNSYRYREHDWRRGHQKIIINCCSRSFHFKGSLPEDCLFWDHNYNHIDHTYLNSHCDYRDGLELLERQAKHALRFWQIS